MHISVQNEFFDFSKEVETFSSKLDNIGALVTFTGIVRGQKSKTLDYMLIEHYPGMTETQIKLIVEETFKLWINHLYEHHTTPKPAKAAAKRTTRQKAKTSSASS